MSFQSDGRITFANKSVDGTSCIAFEIVETFEKGGKTGTKLTTNFRFGNNYGDETFFATYYKPGEGDNIVFDNLSALVFICHGYAEYFGDDYDDLSKQICTQLGDGCLVFGHDHVGHGRTTAGERVLVNGMHDFVEPVVAHIEEVQKWKTCGGKHLPVFLIGHSMGGLISLCTMLKNQYLFKGFIGIGPLVMLNPDSATPFKKLLAQHIQKHFPGFALPTFIDRIDTNQITRDSNIAEKMKNDKLRWHGGTKARMGWQLMQNCEFIQNNLSNLRIPLLVLQGEKDKLVVPAGAKMILDKASSSDKQYKEYPDALHQLLVELDDVKTDVQKTIFDWISQRL